MPAGNLLKKWFSTVVEITFHIKTKNYNDLKVLVTYSVSRKLRYKYTSITINNYPVEQNMFKVTKKIPKQYKQGEPPTSTPHQNKSNMTHKTLEPALFTLFKCLYYYFQ